MVDFRRRSVRRRGHERLEYGIPEVARPAMSVRGGLHAGFRFQQRLHDIADFRNRSPPQRRGIGLRIVA